jgi:hypothetical protein
MSHSNPRSGSRSRSRSPRTPPQPAEEDTTTSSYSSSSSSSNTTTPSSSSLTLEWTTDDQAQCLRRLQALITPRTPGQAKAKKPKQPKQPAYPPPPHLLMPRYWRPPPLPVLQNPGLLPARPRGPPFVPPPLPIGQRRPPNPIPIAPPSPERIAQPPPQPAHPPPYCLLRAKASLRPPQRLPRPLQNAPPALAPKPQMPVGDILLGLPFPLPYLPLAVGYIGDDSQPPSVAPRTPPGALVAHFLQNLPSERERRGDP